MFDNVERVAATVAGLGLFAVNDIRLLASAAREPAAGLQRTVLQAGDLPDVVFLTALDAATRWGLAGLTLMLAAWALAETLPRGPGRRVRE